MLIKKINLNNIRSYKNQEINFSNGSILLSGDIGSGKTSILLGIEFALFGLQPGQRGTSLLRNGENQGGVIIEFEVYGKEIIIERTLKRGKSVSQDYCAITYDGVKSESSVTELKNKVLEILNYPKEFAKKQNILYKFTIYIPQEEMKQIILQDPDSRVNTLRHVFGIDKYKKIIENTSIIASKLREEKKIKEAITSTLEQDKLNIVSKENELETKHSNLISVEKEFFLKTEEKRKAQEERDQVSKKIEEKRNLQQEIEKTKIMILNKNELISNNLKLIEQLKHEIKEISDLKFDESKILLLEKAISECKDKREKLGEENLAINSQITSLQIKNEDNESLEKRLSNLKSCPTCLQDVDALYRTNVLNKIHTDISENNQKIKIFEDEKNQVLEKIKTLDFDLSSKEKELSDLKMLKIKHQGIEEKEKRLLEIDKINVSLEKDINLLNEQIGVVNQSVFELKKYDNIFELKQKELDNSIRQERLAEIKVAELKKEIDVFSRQIEELKERLKNMEKLREELVHITKLEDWLSKKFVPVVTHIEKNVMVKLKVEFSRLFSEWFNMLVSDSFNVRLDDNFTPIIELQDYEIDYAYLSGGERTAIALAYRLSLNQVINSILSKVKTRDLVILDEPTDGFSEQQLDKMRDVLQQLNVGQLIIVSHEQKIEGFVENVIKFKKENGESFMEK